MRLGVTAALLVFASVPAAADTTAVYATPGGRFRMVVEIASDGDLRSDVAARPGTYLLQKNGQRYVVQPINGTTVVDRIEDLSDVMANASRARAAKLGPDFQRFLNDHLQRAYAPMVEGGSVTVHGRSGVAYFSTVSPRDRGGKPVLVISHDPALAAIGVAMAGQFDVFSRMMAASLGASPRQMNDIASVLRTGAPLLFAGAELATVSDAPIPASRFDLPKEPETPAELRKRYKAMSSRVSITLF